MHSDNEKILIIVKGLNTGSLSSKSESAANMTLKQRMVDVKNSSHIFVFADRKHVMFSLITEADTDSISRNYDKILNRQ